MNFSGIKSWIVVCCCRRAAELQLQPESEGEKGQAHRLPALASPLLRFATLSIICSKIAQKRKKAEQNEKSGTSSENNRSVFKLIPLIIMFLCRRLKFSILSGYVSAESLTVHFIPPFRLPSFIRPLCALAFLHSPLPLILTRSFLKKVLDVLHFSPFRSFFSRVIPRSLFIPFSN